MTTTHSVGGAFAYPLTGDAVAAPEWVSRAAFARRLGVTRQAVDTAIKAGRLDDAAFNDDDTLLNLRVARAQWIASRDPKKDEQLSFIDEETGETELVVPDADAKQPRSLTQARLEKLDNENRLLERKVGVEEGRYRDVYEMAAALEEVTGAFVQEIEGIINWTDDVMALRDKDEPTVRLFLEERIHTLRLSISQRMQVLTPVSHDQRADA